MAAQERAGEGEGLRGVIARSAQRDEAIGCAFLEKIAGGYAALAMTTVSANGLLA